MFPFEEITLVARFRFRACTEIRFQFQILIMQEVLELSITRVAVLQLFIIDNVMYNYER